eukprot:4544529-Amphidinium_carterae.1
MFDLSETVDQWSTEPDADNAFFKSLSSADMILCSAVEIVGNRFIPRLTWSLVVYSCRNILEAAAVRDDEYK